MNQLSTCAFACTAAFIYKKIHKLNGAIIGLVVGWLAMAAVMVLWNYIMTPIYLASLSTGWSDREAMAEAVGKLRPYVATMLIPVFLPFNLLKGGLNAAITMLIYKPVRTGLDRSGIMPASEGHEVKPIKLNVGVMLISAFILITGILLILVYQGVI